MPALMETQPMTELDIAMQALSVSAQHFGAEIQAAQTDGDPRAGCLAALCFHAAGLGHSCLQLSGISGAFPEFTVALDAAELQALFRSNGLAQVIASTQGCIEQSLLVVFGERLYLKKFWRMETELVSLLQARLEPRELPSCADVAQDLAALCQHKRLVFLTGGPGTGKTTAMSGAVAHWLAAFESEQGRTARVVLCAPTGKAAARLSTAWQQHGPALTAGLSDAQRQSLPAQASTLHRVLGFSGMRRDEAVLAVDLMVVDEASMIDLPLMRRLLRALPESAHLLLIGDPKQLPSIEIGNVLGALLDAKPDTAFGLGIQSCHRQLRFNHRQAARPGLAAVAEAIQNEVAELFVAKLCQGAFSDVTYAASSAQALNTVLDAQADFHRKLGLLATPELALRQLQQQVLLTPLRHGVLGCEHLNAQIARRVGHHLNRHGQALLITQNVPALGLANGDIGLIWNDGERLSAYFRGASGLFSLPMPQLPEHEAAYALTIHKAQGSEFETLDLLLPESPQALVSKALLYTAVTRAKHALRITANPAALLAGLNHDIRRMNGLMAIAAFSEIENTADYSGNTD